MKCRNCTNLHLIKECKNLLWCDDVLDAPDPDAERECEYFKLATNADRIRGMTDEELALILSVRHYCPLKRMNKCSFYFSKDDGCSQCWLDWLKAPVEEAQDD